MKSFLITLSCLFAAIEGGYSVSIHGTFQCACNTDHCRNESRTTCEDAMCYTQYLKKRDGSNPITKGCLPTKTSLLCENRRPRTAANWPILVCCEKYMCNNELPPQLAQVMGGVYGYTNTGNGTATAGPAISSDLPSNSLPRNFSDSSNNSSNANANNNGGVIENPRDEEAEIDFNRSNSASRDLTAIDHQADTNPLMDSDKIFNNPRFMDSIKKKTTTIKGAADDANGLSTVPADGGATGLTAFHVAVLFTALACLFLLFLFGFTILRRQARFFNGTPYLVGQSVYSKEQTTLTRHDHNCAPTRLPLPSHHSFVGVGVSPMHPHQGATMLKNHSSTSRTNGKHLEQHHHQRQQYQSVTTANAASYDNKIHP
ncbi:uncharacterized protein LOC111267972 [Varroa jacobsoni]|uniref:Activin types I and II receptor domain-containing protein n=1 Tax=Varroa destructor TaxID=109461 RepID=A0A7M7J7J1_VARDE|nr:uncharacterized protein LOC111244436 [Varroa destructor]XP_022702348.1 uncharacterized protein LOC111267972 [Varroa jacobsoni]